MPLMDYDQYLFALEAYETKHWYGKGFRRSLTMQPITDAMRMPAGPGRDAAVHVACLRVRQQATAQKLGQYADIINVLLRQLGHNDTTTHPGARNPIPMFDAQAGYWGGGVTVSRNANDEQEFKMTFGRAPSFRNALSTTQMLTDMWALRRDLPLVSYVGITHLTTMKCYMAPAYCKKPPRDSLAAQKYQRYYGDNNDGLINIIYPEASMTRAPEITMAEIRGRNARIPIYDFPAVGENSLLDNPDWIEKVSSIIDGQAHKSLCQMAAAPERECLGWALKFTNQDLKTEVKMRFTSGRNLNKFNDTVMNPPGQESRDMNFNYSFCLADWLCRCLGGSNLKMERVHGKKITWVGKFGVTP